MYILGIGILGYFNILIQPFYNLFGPCIHDLKTSLTLARSNRPKLTKLQASHNLKLDFIVNVALAYIINPKNRIYCIVCEHKRMSHNNFHNVGFGVWPFKC